MVAAGDAFVAKVALTLLQGPSTAHPGGTVTFELTASDDVGLLYQVASSFGTGPMPIGQREIHLSPDPLDKGVGQADLGTLTRLT